MRLILLFILFLGFSLQAQNFEKDTGFNPYVLPTDKYYVENKPSLSILQPDQKLILVENYFLNINYSKITRIKKLPKSVLQKFLIFLNL